jgi:ABC-type phosphate/phosphonate transport system substrate-binding protein
MIMKIGKCALVFSIAICLLLTIQPAGWTCQIEPSTISHPVDSDSKNQIVLIVMDPMSSQLACDCVEGYAQRDYQKFALHLSKKTGRPVHVVFSETFEEALRESNGKADVVIGKHSVVTNGAKAAKVSMVPKFRLTDKLDSTEQTGLLVVRRDNPAKSVADLKGYRVLFGPAECDEKYSAPMALLKENGIEISAPAAEDICSACSVAAKSLMEVSDSDKVVGVISSYAQPLLEGCGNIKKGDLRVVGESKPVPFVTAFFNREFLKEDLTMVEEAFTDVALDVDLMAALETSSGFIEWTQKSTPKPEAEGQPSVQAADSKKKT